MKLTVARAKELLCLAQDKRILVVGDLMMDRFVYGSVSRISPEAPVPVVQVSRETSMPGGACNVASNLLALGGKASMAGVVGRDEAGIELRKQLAANEVLLEAVLENERHPTCIKTRIVAEHQQVVRVDYEEYLQIPNDQAILFCQLIEREAAQADGIVIGDYGKGSVRQDVVDTVLTAAAKIDIPVGYDPKKGHILNIQGIHVVTPNRQEAFGFAGLTEGNPFNNPLEDSQLLEAGRMIKEKWKARHTLITLGAHGMLLLDKSQPALHIPTRAREVFDVSGAGDTVIAAFVLALSCGASCIEAAELANCAAGVVVRKLGTASCTPNELIADMPGSYAEAKQ